jgi:truncated hemoglobin YjbI
MLKAKGIITKETRRRIYHHSLDTMSKLDLQQAAHERSGVSYEESLLAVALSPSLYERLGAQGIRELSEAFYDRVFNDQETRWFLNIFSSSTRDEAIENQYYFLVQTFGGPDLYRQKKGKYTRLAGRHANYQIGSKAAEQWVRHMKSAMGDHSILRYDEQAREVLTKYFQYTAHYIVVAMEYMRPDQVSAYSLFS